MDVAAVGRLGHFSHIGNARNERTSGRRRVLDGGRLQHPVIPHADKLKLAAHAISVEHERTAVFPLLQAEHLAGVDATDGSAVAGERSLVVKIGEAMIGDALRLNGERITGTRFGKESPREQDALAFEHEVPMLAGFFAVM